MRKIELKTDKAGEELLNEIIRNHMARLLGNIDNMTSYKDRESATELTISVTFRENGKEVR